MIAPACGLKGVFAEAVEAFLGVLDRYSLAVMNERRAAAIPQAPSPRWSSARDPRTDRRRSYSTVPVTG
ncbi:MAG: hypothetical protein R3F20_10435 [Planctomycetota bacterium]